jgi:hypothetical protein
MSNLQYARPTQLGTTVNGSAITRPPVVGNIDQLAIPSTAQTSTISEDIYIREFNAQRLPGGYFLWFNLYRGRGWLDQLRELRDI